MSIAVEVEGLQSRRGEFVLGPLSFTSPPGGRLAIVGPSGSGKSTLLRCLAGFERPQLGSIRIGQQCVSGPQQFVNPDRRGLGFVFQDGALWPQLTALAHLRFAAPGLSRAAAQQLLQRAGIGHLGDRKPGEMSGGEAQRLGLLRALAGRPPLLLLDEPLRSVDVHQRDGLILLLRNIADEWALSTILVTHDRDEALALADQLLVLHGGQLVEQGPAQQLLQSPQTAFTAAFLAGAACLPTQDLPTRPGYLQTALGDWPRPADAGSSDLRLVLMPGEAVAEPGSAAHGARVLGALPAASGWLLRVALGEQIVVARATHSLPTGSPVLLNLPAAPRLLPWQRSQASPTGFAEQ